jgi:hypothetical protein
LSQTALRVSDVGVARTLVRFHPMVTIWFGAILKKDVAVCGGWVIVAPPGGSVCAMDGALEAVGEFELAGGGEADTEPPELELEAPELEAEFELDAMADEEDD